MGLFSKTEAGQPPPQGPSPAQSLASVNGEIKSKHGGPRPGSGRKPNPANQVVGGAPQRNQEPVQAPPSEADIEFCRTIAKAGLQILDRVETNIICGTIKSIGDPALEARTEAFLSQREIGPGDIEVVTNAAGALAAKYAILSRYAPEGALLLWSVTHGMAFSNVLQQLKSYAAEVSKAKGIKKNAETDTAPH